jgi:hypothetical protein
MNDRSGETPQADGQVKNTGFPTVVPGLFPQKPAVTGRNRTTAVAGSRKKTAPRPAAKREAGLTRDSLMVIRRGDVYHVVSEDYGYKTESYYTILRHELGGKTVLPSSRAVLDAFVVPVCLERARLAGIPVCDWGISQAYVPLPAVLYALNYFATTSEFFIVEDNEQAKDTIKHITNKGKYPFCYQKLPDGAAITSCTAIFGRTCGPGTAASAQYAEKIYELFAIPLVRMVFVSNGDATLLSSLSPVRYNQLTEAERSLLSACCTGQEFL